jgi:PIN domain nuclease of toxin-antitoxin system
VKLLLDTCAFIWLTQEPAKLSSTAQAAIDDPANELLFSHASAWEMHLKHHAGKLNLPESSRAWIPQQMRTWKIQGFPIDIGAIHRTSDLAHIHLDPFDRMLAAQALENALAIVSPDDTFPKYGVRAIW